MVLTATFSKIPVVFHTACDVENLWSWPIIYQKSCEARRTSSRKSIGFPIAQVIQKLEFFHIQLHSILKFRAERSTAKLAFPPASV